MHHLTDFAAEVQIPANACSRMTLQHCKVLSADISSANNWAHLKRPDKYIWTASNLFLVPSLLFYNFSTFFELLVPELSFFFQFSEFLNKRLSSDEWLPYVLLWGF